MTKPQNAIAMIGLNWELFRVVTFNVKINDIPLETKKAVFSYCESSVYLTSGGGNARGSCYNSTKLTILHMN